MQLTFDIEWNGCLETRIKNCQNASSPLTRIASWRKQQQRWQYLQYCRMDGEGGRVVWVKLASKNSHILPLRSCYPPSCQKRCCTHDALSLLSAPVTRAPKTPTMRAAAMIAYMIVPEISGAGMESMVEKQTCSFGCYWIGCGLFRSVRDVNEPFV